MMGAILAFTSRAIFRAIAMGAVMSAPLLTTPCGSSVPVGKITVLIFDGTTSLNSIQLISLMSRVVTASDVCADAVPATRQRVRHASALRIIAGSSLEFEYLTPGDSLSRNEALSSSGG